MTSSGVATNTAGYRIRFGTDVAFDVDHRDRDECDAHDGVRGKADVGPETHRQTRENSGGQHGLHSGSRTDGCLAAPHLGQLARR